VINGTDVDLSATANEFAALLCEFKTDIATYLETYVDGTNPVTGQAYPQTLAELIAFNQAHPELEGPWNDLLFELAEATNGRDGACAEIRAGVTPPVQAEVDQLMAENDLDAIIALTNGPAWPTNDNPNEGDLDGHFEYFVGSSSAAAVSGYADITVPAGYVAGLPMGITFIGGRWAEPELLGFAYDYEQATQVRVPPQFIPTIGDDLFPGAPNPAEQARALRQQATQGQRDFVVRFR
jgi:amidase